MWIYVMKKWKRKKREKRMVEGFVCSIVPCACSSAIIDISAIKKNNINNAINKITRIKLRQVRSKF